MKKTLFYTTMVFLVLFFSQCGPTMQEAIDYNDKIINDQVLVINSINDLEAAIGTFDTLKIITALERAKSKVNSTKASLILLGGFNENNEFQEATIKLYDLFESQLNNEYAEELEIYKLSDDDYTAEKKERFNELILSLNNRYQVVFENFLASQKKFAETWGFTLEED